MRLDFRDWVTAREWENIDFTVGDSFTLQLLDAELMITRPKRSVLKVEINPLNAGRNWDGILADIAIYGG